MIRPVTFVTAVMALSSGAWMFVVKHQAEQLDRSIGGVTAQIRAAEQRTEVLRAEWALETDPNRLVRLTGLFLPGLKPMLPDQMTSWSGLAARLPPVGAAVPHLPFPPPLPDQLPDDPADVVVAATTMPSLPMAPTRLAAARATLRAQASVLRRVVVHHPLVHRPTHVVPPRWRRPPGRPIPLGDSVLAPSRQVRPMGAQVMTINARPASQARPASAPSVFGGYAADLPPPRPAGGGVP